MDAVKQGRLAGEIARLRQVWQQANTKLTRQCRGGDKRLIELARRDERSTWNRLQAAEREYKEAQG